jgi:hypothetical protein
MANMGKPPTTTQNTQTPEETSKKQHRKTVGIEKPNN